MRVHHRSQMEAAGLGPILGICKEFHYAGLDTQLAKYEDLLEEDHKQLLQNFNQDILRDMTDPYDVYRTILSSVEGTDAFKYFLSAMQHLLLVRADDEVRTRYYQLIDSLVTSVVLDKKQSFSGGLSNTIGLSVEQLIAQFGEQERTQQAEKEAAELRSQLGRLRIEKETLEEELTGTDEGLVGVLKGKLAAAEDKLRISRETTEALQAQMIDLQRSYEEQILQMELQISELFKMLKESRGFATALDSSKGMDRKELIYSLSKQMERKKTIGILEGRRGRDATVDSDTDEGEDAAQSPSAAERRRKAITRRRVQVGVSGVNPENRTSQFADADEERVRVHIEESLAAGAELMASLFFQSIWLINLTSCPVSAIGCCGTFSQR